MFYSELWDSGLGIFGHTIPYQLYDTGFSGFPGIGKSKYFIPNYENLI